MGDIRDFLSRNPDLRECGLPVDDTNKIDCIVVKDLSRFGRNYKETGSYLEQIFPALDVRFIAVEWGVYWHLGRIWLSEMCRRQAPD